MIKSEKINLPFGLDENNILVHVANVESGEKCNCFCPGCKSPLIAVKGKIRQHHFRHKDTVECKGGLESAIHLAAKQVIIENKRISLPEYPINVSLLDSKGYCHSDDYLMKGGDVIFDSVDEEVSLHGMRADILAKKDGVPLIIEVFYRHKVDDEKIERIMKGQISAVEIDLSDLSHEDVKDMDSFRLFTNDSKRVSWLNNIKANGIELMIKERLRNEIHALEEKYKQDEIIKQRREQHEIIRRQKQALSEKPDLLRALEELKMLRSKEYVDEITQNANTHPAWKIISKDHHLKLDELPDFLNIDVHDGGWIFGCDRRVWQSAFYYEFFIKRKGGKNYFSIKWVDEWLRNTALCRVPHYAEIVGKYGRRYPELVPPDVSENIPSPWKTLRAYFKHLEKLGMMLLSGNDRKNKGSFWYVIINQAPIMKNTYESKSSDFDFNKYLREVYDGYYKEMQLNRLI